MKVVSIHKKIIFPIFLIFVIIVIGCTPSSSSSKTKEVDVFVGTDGLSAEFAKTAPPPKVFEDSNFPILLRIRNKGAYSIQKDNSNKPSLRVVLSLSREKDYVKTLKLEENSRVYGSASDDSKAFFFVDGKTTINPQGDEIIVSFNAKTGKLDPQSEVKQSTIPATLCYPYQTVLSTTVCIDTDVAGVRPGKKVCSVKEIVFNSGQGAPITVTKIEPQMIPVENDMVKPQFLIFVENKGKGNPVNLVGYYDACSKSDYKNDLSNFKKDLWNVATVKVYKAGKETDPESQLVCTPSLKSSEGAIDETIGLLRFRDNKDFVRCTFKNGLPRNSDAFTSPLKIIIDYGYVQSIVANFFIEKPYKR